MIKVKQQGRLIQVISLTILLLAGCNTKTPEESVKKAQQHYSQGNIDVAIIELKNVLQKKPNMVSALTQLNKIYAEKYQYSQIISLLMIPVEEGLSDRNMLYSLTDALVHEARFEQAFSIINSHSNEFLTAQGLALKGHCFAGLNKTEEANQYYQEALSIDDGLISAHLGLAQEAIIIAGKNKSEQIQTQKKQPSDWVTRSESITLVDSDFIKSARFHLQKVFTIDPDNIIGNYLAATIFYLEKNITEAQVSLRVVLKVDPDHRESLLLMGKLHLELAHLDKSEKFLERYLTIMPDDLKARMYLASIMLRKHQPDRALGLLEEYLDKGESDPEYLLVLGNIYLVKNNNDLAIDYFEKANVLYPKSVLVKMYSAMAYLGRGDQDKNDIEVAIQLLNKILEVEPDNKQAGISLVTTLLQKSDYKNAEKVSANLIKFYPKESMPQYLMGLSWQGLDNEENAIVAYRKTLDLNHSFIPATIRLAKIYQNKGDYELAQKQYEIALYDSPYNPDIMTEMALSEQKVGNNKKAIELLELARDRNQDALSPRLLLGTYYLRRGQINTAQIIINELNKLAPERPDVQMYFGQIKLATGRSAEAVAIFSKLIQIEPDAPEILVKYGSALRMNGQIKESRKALKTAWAFSDGMLAEALVEQGKLELAERNYQDLGDIITDLQKEFPELAGGYVLEGDLAMHQKNSSAAIMPFELAIERDDKTSIVLKLFEAYTQSGMEEVALGLLEKSVKKRPDDVRLGMTFATVKQQSGDPDAAINIYQDLLKIYPENGLILNNLAWVYDNSDRRKALLFAEKAYQVTPELPQVLDSYGWFCFLDGRLEEGLSLLKTAVKKAPSEPEFHYHLAAAQIQSGETKLARQSLENALASQEDFNGRHDAEALLLKLGRGGGE